MGRGQWGAAEVLLHQQHEEEAQHADAVEDEPAEHGRAARLEDGVGPALSTVCGARRVSLGELQVKKEKMMRKRTSSSTTATSLMTIMTRKKRRRRP